MKKFFSYNKGYTIKKAGFTIVETLVAVAILMIAIAGPLTVAHNGLQAAVTARDRLVASFLAQDALEYIKSVRDENIAENQTNWLNEIADNPDESCNTIEDECTVDTLYNIFASGNSEVYKTPEGWYTHDESAGNTVSPFTRYYTYERYTGDYGRIRVYVQWYNGTYQNEFILTSSIYKVNR